MRTFTRSDWEAANGQWADFSDEWAPYRRLAAERGMLYPPSGEKWDSWADDEPSQRALIIRAIRETPRLLTEILRRSRSWSYVIGELNRQRDEWRELDALEQRYIARQRADEPNPIEATASLAGILTRIKDSTG